MDERVRKLRRMLEVSRYADVRCGALYEDLFVGRPIALQRRIFDRLVSDGVFAPCDTFLAAQQFHGPMLMVMGAEADADQAPEVLRATPGSVQRGTREESMKAAIVYCSQTGHTEKYARWLADRLGCEATPFSKRASVDLDAIDV